MIPSILLFILCWVSSINGSLIGQNPKTSSILAKEMPFHNPVAQKVSDWNPIGDEFDAMGLLGSILYSCIGKGQQCTQEEFEKASANSEVFANYLGKDFRNSMTLKSFILSKGLNALFEEMKYSRNLEIDIVIILSVFLIKLEGNEDDARRIYFHVYSKIQQSGYKNFKLEEGKFFEYLSKLYFIEKNEELFSKELEDEFRRKSFSKIYSEMANYSFECDYDYFVFTPSEILEKTKRFSDVFCKFQNGHFDTFFEKLYGRAIQILLIKQGCLYKFIEKELVRYLRLLKLDLKEAISISQSIRNDQIAEIIFTNLKSNSDFDASPFTQSGIGYLLPKRGLEILFDGNFADILFPRSVSFEDAFSFFQKDDETSQVKGIVGERGSLLPIFIISFKVFSGIFLFGGKPALFDYYFCKSGNSEEVTFSLRDLKLLSYPGVMGIWGKRIGNYLFMTDRLNIPSESFFDRLHSLVLASSPYLLYELKREGFSLLKILGNDPIN
jgi:hypothetical protein